MTYRKILILMAFTLAFLASAFAADVSGKWTAEFDSQIGVQKYTFEFKVDAGKLTGKAISQFGTSEIQDGKVSGDDVSFVEMQNYEGQQLRIVYTGKVAGDEIKFNRNVAEMINEPVVAKRAK